MFFAVGGVGLRIVDGERLCSGKNAVRSIRQWQGEALILLKGDWVIIG